MARIEQVNKAKRMKEQFGENKFMLKHKKMTQKEDDAFDKRMGWKEGSRADLAQDKRSGIKDKKKHKKGDKQRIIRMRGFKK